jgi:four helix bundle protein
MFGFRKLDVYKCAVEALPLAYQFAERADAETKRCDGDQRQFYRIARGSALECGAVLDALQALGLVTFEETAPLKELLVRIVAMLTKMSAP